MEVRSLCRTGNVLVSDLLNLKNFGIKIIVKLVNKIIILPEELNIVRVYKSGSKKLMNNYRPISVISVLLNLLLSYECSFLCTNMAIISADLMNYLSTYLDRGNMIRAVFIDLRKAFDIVSYDLLLNKLRLIGFRGVILRLLEVAGSGDINGIEFQEVDY